MFVFKAPGDISALETEIQTAFDSELAQAQSDKKDILDDALAREQLIEKVLWFVPYCVVL